MAANTVCVMAVNEWHSAHQWWGLKAVAAVAPEADTLRNVASFIKPVLACRASFAGYVRTLAMVGVLAAQQLACHVVEDLHRQARRGVAMGVSSNEPHVLAWRCDNPKNLMCAFFCRRPCRTLRHVILSHVAADTEHAMYGVGVDVVHRVVLLEIPAELEVAAQWLILPRHLLQQGSCERQCRRADTASATNESNEMDLIYIKKVPAVVASAQPTHVGADIAGGVLITKYGLARILLAPERKTNLPPPSGFAGPPRY